MTVCSESFNVDMKRVNLLQNVMLQRAGSQLQGGAGEMTDTDEGHNRQGCHHKVLSLQVIRCNNYILLHVNSSAER